MGTNVFSVTFDNPDYTGHRKSLDYAKTNYTIWVDKDKVSISEGKWLTGVRYNQNHRWWRWRTVRAYGFVLSKGGLPAPWMVKRRDEYKGQGPFINTIPRAPVDLLSEDTVLTEAFKTHMWKTFKVNTFDGLYPMAQEFGISKLDGMPLSIRRGFRENSMDDFTAWCFGSKRKALTPVVASTDPYFINLAREYRGFVPDAQVAEFMRSQRVTDQLEQALEGFSKHSVAGYVSPRFRKGLASLEPQEVSDLIEQPIGVAEYNNLIRVSMTVNHPKWRTPTVSKPVGNYVDFERRMYVGTP